MSIELPKLKKVSKDKVKKPKILYFRMIYDYIVESQHNQKKLYCQQYTNMIGYSWVQHKTP